MEKFVIPLKFDELLNEPQGLQYYVREILSSEECEIRLQNLADDFENNGLSAIRTYFDVYYSILTHEQEKPELNEFLRYLYELRRMFEKIDLPVEFDLNPGEKDEIRNHFLMICYIYMEMAMFMDGKCQEIIMKAKMDNFLQKKREKQKTTNIEMNWNDERREMLKMLKRLFEKPLENLWLPKVPDEDFINIFSLFFVQILQYDKIKNEKEVIEYISDVYGILASRFTKSISFLYQLVELVKRNEHAIQIVGNLVYDIVNKHKLNSILKKITEELTQWQISETDETSESDNKAAKHCSMLLAQLSTQMSELMLPIIQTSFERFLQAPSYYFRNSILSVIADVILKTFTKDDLSDDEMSSRNGLFDLLIMHSCDVTSFVRVRVFQMLTKLQGENAIPLTYYFIAFEKASARLKDKAISVRKYAIIFINCLIESNPFSANLSYENAEEELRKLEDTLSSLSIESSEWLKYEKEVEQFLKKEFEKGTFNSPMSAGDIDSADELSEELFFNYITNGCYDKLIDCIKYFEHKNDTFKIRNVLSTNNQLSFLMLMLKQMFVNFNNVNSPIEQMTVLFQKKKFYQDLIKFVKMIDKIFDEMYKQMSVVTPNITLHCFDFFEISYNFNVRNSIKGIIRMLEVMNVANEDEKKHITGIYHRIFMSNNEKRISASEIVLNLIDLVKKLSNQEMKSLNEILHELTEANEISGNVVMHLWDLFTNKSEAETSETRYFALKIITVFAEKNPQIIKNNTALLNMFGFEQIGVQDLNMMAQLCRAYLVLCPKTKDDDTGGGGSSSSSSSSNEANKLKKFFMKIEDPFWDRLKSIFVDGFDSNDSDYTTFVQAGVELIYKLCSHPHMFVNNMFEKLRTEKLSGMKQTAGNLSKLIFLLAQIAYWNFSYLDNIFYTELKKRSGNRKSKRNLDKDSSTLTNATEETTKSEQDIADVEVINRLFDQFLVRENGKNILSAYIPLIRSILTFRKKFGNERLQCYATLALISYSLISRKFCDKNMQLLMTVLEKTEFDSVKMNIIHGFSDLLNRFPNITEPWLCYVEKQLKLGDINVRKTNLIILQSLTLRESIRPKTCIVEIARTLVDPNEDIQSLSKGFFNELSSKTNHLYNLIPEIISKLSSPDSKCSNQDFQIIASFIFELIKKDKQIDCLIDSLCRRLENIENQNQCRCIVFCLSLFQFNEKRIEKLTQLFECYKNKLSDPEIYEVFMKIIKESEKTIKKDDNTNLANNLMEMIKGATISKTNENAEDKENEADDVNSSRQSINTRRSSNVQNDSNKTITAAAAAAEKSKQVENEPGDANNSSAGSSENDDDDDMQSVADNNSSRISRRSQRSTRTAISEKRVSFKVPQTIPKRKRH